MLACAACLPALTEPLRGVLSMLSMGLGSEHAAGLLGGISPSLLPSLAMQASTPNPQGQQACCLPPGASLVAAQLSAIADAVLQPAGSCVDLVVNLSEADFPVQSSAAIKRRLHGLIGSSRLDFFTRQASGQWHAGAACMSNAELGP